MKKVILSVAIVTVLGLVGCKNDVKKAEEKQNSASSVEVPEESQELSLTNVSFGVRGNCSMCKKTIENAANAVDGVAKADWDKTQKKIDVKFDDNKTDLMNIHKAISILGYDTEKVNADEKAYTSLPECCQYDPEMKMSQTSEVQE